MIIPKIFGYTGKALFSYHSTTNTFQTVGQFRERKFGRVSDKQMYIGSFSPLNSNTSLVNAPGRYLPHKSTPDVGIDRGIKRFATLSDGTVYNPLNSFKGKAEKLAKFQRQLKNKKKISNNWKQVNVKITKCHEDIANARKDYLHKVSTEVCDNQAMILVEDLKT